MTDSSAIVDSNVQVDGRNCDAAVPGSIPDVEKGGLTGWENKERATGRSLAFWLNQGAKLVLLQSAYEPRGGRMNHCIPPSGWTTLVFDIRDNVTMLRFKMK